MIFFDRLDAGAQLAEAVVARVKGKGIVLGIPRGGMVLAKIVTKRLGWPLQSIYSKKISSPGDPELAVGAKVKPPYPDLQNVSQALIVDDGVATGFTLEAAINYLRRQSVKVIVAVPVAAKDSAEHLKKLADAWICLFEPAGLTSVGQYYNNFEQ